MANTLGNYNPAFYAQESLILLENALGMSGRVHRGYEQERSSFNRGDTINIKKPSTFTVNNAPATAEDLTTESVAITLNQWKEVKFKLSDKELSFTGEQIIDQHIRPAAYALANTIDVALATEYQKIGWQHDLNNTGSIDVSDVTDIFQILFDNGVPVDDANQLHYMVNGQLRNELTQLAAFAQNQGAGDTGIATQRDNSLGIKYGMEIFANQNVQTYTAGALTSSTPKLKGLGVVGATSITIDDTTQTGDVNAGDTLLIAGSTQKYAITADATAGSNETICAISPGLVVAHADNAAVTVTQSAKTATNIAFHKNAFALAVAPLSTLGADVGGAQIFTATSPDNTLSIRARIYYVGNSSEVHVALDILYGYKTLDPNLACRAQF